MIGKIISVMVVLAMLIFSFGILYDNLPRDPVELTPEISIPVSIKIFDYGSTPVFSENLRFNHDDITYSLESSCSFVRASAMREAFRIFAGKMDVLSFMEIANGDADILVSCSDDFIGLDENLFAAGEGGPSEIINTSNFKTIRRGKILLYKDARCERPVVEIHEIGHVFGFDHSADPRSIMYNTSDCSQEITPDMIKLINDLYSIKPLPDARISELSAIKRGKYLDFNITVLNEGLIGIENINLTLISGDEVIETIPLNNIDFGYGRTLRAKDMRLPSRSIEEIDFILDYEEVVEEWSEDNNVIKVTIATV